MTPPHQQRLSELTQKIAECVTSVRYGEYLGTGEDGEEIWRQRDITLEDVLGAFGEREMRLYLSMGILAIQEDKTRRSSEWILGKPLSEQPEGTISFLHSILCV